MDADIGHLRRLVEVSGHLFLLLLLPQLLLLLPRVLLVLLDHVGQLIDVLVGLGEEEGQAFVFLLVDQLPVAFLVLGHQPPETLLLDALLLLLLLPLGVGVPRQHGLVQLLHLGLIVLVEVAQLATVRKYGVQEILPRRKNSLSCQFS